VGEKLKACLNNVDLSPEAEALLKEADTRGVDVPEVALVRAQLWMSAWKKRVNQTFENKYSLKTLISLV